MFKKFIYTMLTLILILGLAYGAGIGFYSNKFQANTKIGQVDVSNLTLPEAEEKISSYILSQDIELKENGQPVGSLNMKDVDPKFNNLENLKTVFNHQNPNAWLSYFLKGEAYENDLLSDVQIDNQALNEVLLKNGVIGSDRIPSQDAFIDYNENQGYHVVNEKLGNQLDSEELKNGLLSQVIDGDSSIELNQFYIKPTVTYEDEKIQEFLNQIEDITSTKITLDIEGNEEVIPKSEIEKWLYFDMNNKVVFDNNMIMEFLKQYNDKYSSYLNTRKFNSTWQGQVTIQPGTLGWSIDREAEANQIITDLNLGQDVKRDPVVVGTGYGIEGNDIGDTYVEVDIINQTMFVYKNGELAIQTPIVSGRDGAETVPGAYAVWSKETNRDLTGYDWVWEKEYRVPVDYWMPFDTIGQGIHDTQERAAFGGNIYRSSGSLGCINTPIDAMRQVFNLVEIGTPVIVF